MKRLFDFCIALTMIIVLLPLIVLLAIVVRIKLGSPIFFEQLRPGLHTKPFYIYKFRTMTNEKDDKGKYLSNELRLTKFGQLLRKFSLDELPQLFNVIRGDISLVGPRPLLMEYLPLYSTEQARRHEVKPGVTGWAQVNGRNSITWEEKFALDVWYVDNQSFYLDCKILFFTVLKVLKSEGINQKERVSMEPFQGTQQQNIL